MLGSRQLDVDEIGRQRTQRERRLQRGDAGPGDQPPWRIISPEPAKIGRRTARAAPAILFDLCLNAGDHRRVLRAEQVREAALERQPLRNRTLPGGRYVSRYRPSTTS